MHSWDCKRFYVLHQDDTEELHYLHKNGMLYIYNETYDTNSYCIENILNSLNLTEVRYSKSSLQKKYLLQNHHQFNLFLPGSLIHMFWRRKTWEPYEIQLLPVRLISFLCIFSDNSGCLPYYTKGFYALLDI